MARVTLAQIAPSLNQTNLERVLAIIDGHRATSDLIVFPELTLNGYLLQDKLYEDAWSIEELEPLAKASSDVDIVVGAALREGKRFYNSALFFSQGRLLGIHQKIDLPNYGMFEEARYFSAGKQLAPIQKGSKQIAMLICEDLWSSNVHSMLYDQELDYIIVIAASPARGFEDDGLLIQKQWQALIAATALKIDATVIFVNRVGFEDGLGFWGGSCIVDSSCKELALLPCFKEQIASFEVNL